MVTGDDSETDTESTIMRFGKLSVSIAVLTFVTVVAGYGGWALLTVSAKLGGPDPETNGGELLRKRLLAWPERNRNFMRNNGHGTLPLKP